MGISRAGRGGFRLQTSTALQKHPIADLAALWDRGFVKRAGNDRADAQGHGFRYVRMLSDPTRRLSAKPQYSQS
jgi:hypothetical protein